MPIDEEINRICRLASQRGSVEGAIIGPGSAPAWMSSLVEPMAHEMEQCYPDEVQGDSSWGVLRFNSGDDSTVLAATREMNFIGCFCIGSDGQLARVYKDNVMYSLDKRHMVGNTAWYDGESEPKIIPGTGNRHENVFLFLDGEPSQTLILLKLCSDLAVSALLKHALEAARGRKQSILGTGLVGALRGDVNELRAVVEDFMGGRVIKM
jgi:hypothetical protein